MTPTGLTIESGSDPLRAVVASVVLATVGFIVFMGMPLIVGALVDQYHFTEGEAGYIDAVEYCGMLVAASMVSSILGSVRRRRLASVGLAVALTSNIVSISLVSFQWLLVARFCSGLGSGCAYAVAVAVLAGTAKIGRNFMYLIFGQVLVNALVLYTFPHLIMRWGISGAFVGYSAAIGCGASVISWIPDSTNCAARQRQSGSDGSDLRNRLVPWMCVAAVFCFYLMIGGYWGYIERLGIHLGFDDEFVGVILAAGTLLSLLACLVAYRVGEHHGQSRPLLFALGLVSCVHLGFAIYFNALTYLIDIAVVFSLWNFIDIYQLGTISALDPSGKFAARVPAAQSLAMTIAPASAGFLLDRGFGYRLLLVLFAACVATAFAAYAFAHWSKRQVLRH